MLERERTDPRKRSDLIMTHIKFLHVCEIFELAQCGQRVERQYENFDVFEGADEAQTSDLEVGKIGELQDRRVFDVEFFDVEIILALKQQILVQLVEKRRPAKTVLEVVDQLFHSHRSGRRQNVVVEKSPHVGIRRRVDISRKCRQRKLQW